jgi:hypothetical protein
MHSSNRMLQQLGDCNRRNHQHAQTRAAAPTLVPKRNCLCKPCNPASSAGRAGSPGAVVATVNLIRVRPACTSTPSTLELIKKDQRRSSRFPLPQGPQQQLLDVVNASFRVRSEAGGVG